MSSLPENPTLLAILAPNQSPRPSIDTLRSAVEEQPESQRYELQLGVMKYLVLHCGKKTDAVAKWYDYVLESGIWRQECSEAKFQEEWSHAKQIHGRHLQGLAYIDKIRQKAAAEWGERNARALFTRITTRTMAGSINKFLARNFRYEQLQLVINNELVDRLTRAARGETRYDGEFLMQQDLYQAWERLNTTPLHPDRLWPLGLKYDQDGFLVGGLEAPIIGNESIQPVRQAERTDAPIPDISTSDGLFRPASPGGTCEEAFGNMAGMESTESEGDSVDVKSERFESEESDSQDPEHSVTAPAPWIALSSDQLVPYWRRRSCGIRRRFKCCNLSISLIRRLKTAPDKINDKMKLSMLRKASRLTSFSTGRICFSHTKALCRYLGLRIRQLPHSQLLKRLKYAVKQKDDWENFLQDKPSWFLPSCLPDKGEVENGFFRLAVKPCLPRIARYEELGLSLEDVCLRIYGNEKDVSFWIACGRYLEKIGGANLPNLFGWLEDDIAAIEGVDTLSDMLGVRVKTLKQLIHIEIKMYNYHHIPASSSSHVELNRIMLQSLAHQLICQDVCYYAAHVAFRPDHAWRLVSFPYPLESTHLDENTEYIHRDLKIEDLLAIDTGRDAAQDSVSFTDEDRGNFLALYGFPGVMQLTGLGALSDALLGRVKWSEWSVTVDLDVLFGEDKQAAHLWIQRWRRRAMYQFVEAFQVVVSAEKKAYGEQSYFSLLQERVPVPDMPDVPECPDASECSDILSPSPQRSPIHDMDMYGRML